MPGCRRRSSFSITFEPMAIEVLLCSAESRRTSPASKVISGSRAEVFEKTSLPVSVGISRPARMPSIRQIGKSLEPAAP